LSGTTSSADSSTNTEPQREHGFETPQAIERSLAGGNESARVACVKFLSDLELYRKEGDECPRCAAWKAESKDSQDKVWEMISRYVEHSVRSELGVGRPVESGTTFRRASSSATQFGEGSRGVSMT
jgi:hypothetical protein